MGPLLGAICKHGSRLEIVKSFPFHGTSYKSMGSNCCITPKKCNVCLSKCSRVGAANQCGDITAMLGYLKKIFSGMFFFVKYD